MAQTVRRNQPGQCGPDKCSPIHRLSGEPKSPASFLLLLDPPNSGQAGELAGGWHSVCRTPPVEAAVIVRLGNGHFQQDAAVAHPVFEAALIPLVDPLARLAHFPSLSG